MDSPLSVSSNEFYIPAPPPAGRTINEVLPVELLQKIFSFLGDAETQRAATICMHWRPNVVVNAAQNRFSETVSLVKFLNESLNQSKKESSFTLAPDENILTATNLIEIKSKTAEFKEKIMNSLNTLETKDLETLSKIAKLPSFCADVFYIAKIFKRIDAAKSLPVFERHRMGQVISKELLAAKYFDKALEVAIKVSYNNNRVNALSEIFKTALKIEKAIEFVKKENDEINQNRALADISKALAQNGLIDKALEVAADIPVTFDEKGKLFEEISFAALSQEKFSQAENIANLIPEGLYRSYAFHKIAQSFILRGEFDQAILAANRISDFLTRPRAYRYISNALAKNEQFDKALDVAKKIKDVMERDSANAEVYAHKGDFAKATQLANNILSYPEEHPRVLGPRYRNQALLTITEVLIERGNIVEALNVVNTMPLSEKKIEALQNIAQALRQIGDVEGANKITNNIPDYEYDDGGC